MKLRVIFIMVIALAITACRKKNPGPVPIDTYAASFFTGYQPGTYWIYQDSTGLITDSEAVTYSYCGPPPNINYGEECNIIINSDSPGRYVNFNVIKYIDSVTAAQLAFDNDESSWQEVYTIYFNNNNVDTIDTLYNAGLTVQKLATYQVNQFAFNNALKISYSPPSVPYYMYIVIVPNIGVVERLVPDSGYVLKLKRYHIVS